MKTDLGGGAYFHTWFNSPGGHPAVKAAGARWDTGREEPNAQGTEENGLISSAPANGSLGSRGGSICCDSLDSSVGKDALRELLLRLGEAGSCPPVLRVHLRERAHVTAVTLPVNLHIQGTVTGTLWFLGGSVHRTLRSCQ